jgi:hypothetical protein
VDQGCGRVAPDGEREQVEHLDALGKVRVHVGGNRFEAAVAQVARDQSEMVRAAVGAHLGRHGVEKVKDQERQAKCEEQAFPEGRQGRLALPLGTEPASPERECDDCEAKGLEHSLARQSERGSDEDELAKAGGAGGESEQGTLLAVQPEFEGAQDQIAQGQGSGHRQHSAVQDVEGLRHQTLSRRCIIGGSRRSSG